MEYTAAEQTTEQLDSIYFNRNTIILAKFYKQNVGLSREMDIFLMDKWFKQNRGGLRMLLFKSYEVKFDIPVLTIQDNEDYVSKSKLSCI